MSTKFSALAALTNSALDAADGIVIVDQSIPVAKRLTIGEIDKRYAKQPASDPGTVANNGAGDPVFTTDDQGNAVICANSSSSAQIGLNGPGNAAQPYMQNAVGSVVISVDGSQNPLIRGYSSSGVTPGSAFCFDIGGNAQILDSDGAFVLKLNAGVGITLYSHDTTHAIYVQDSQIQISGLTQFTGPSLGFFGATPIAAPSVPDPTGIDNTQPGSVYAQQSDLAAVVAALKSYGLFQ